MKKLTTFASLIALGCVLLSGAASPLYEARSGAAATKPLVAHQEPRGIGNLVAPGDRVQIVYTLDTAHVRGQGVLYVRNDLQRRFTPLTLKRLGTAGLQRFLPARLIRGHELLYYAVLRDSRSGRTVTIPSRGAAAPQSAFVLGGATIVRLGTHRFGHTRAPDAVVAQAGPNDVGFENNDEFHFGPQTFLVGRNGSVWLHDGLDQRLLLWRAGHPVPVVGQMKLPFFAADNDIALGPAGSVYLLHGMGHGVSSYMALARLSAAGKVLWQSRIAGEMRENGQFVVGGNTSLRVGPDGTLYCLAAMFGLVGGEQAWMPVATPDGRPIIAAQQRRRSD